MRFLFDLYRILCGFVKKSPTIKVLHQKGIVVKIEYFADKSHADKPFTNQFAKYVTSLDELPFFTGQFIQMLTDKELSDLRKIISAEDFYKSNDIMTLILCLASAEKNDWDLAYFDEVDCETTMTLAGCLSNIVYLETLERIGLLVITKYLSIDPKSIAYYEVTGHGKYVARILNQDFVAIK